MTTYNSYEAAKINNPDQDIYKYGDTYRPKSSPCKPNEWWVKCNPADHCMTNNEFIEKGYRVIIGDIVLDDTKVVTISDHNDLETYNTIVECDDTTYILRAAALENKMNIDKLETQSEEQPKRVKYKQLTFNNAWEAVKAFEDGNELYTKRSHKDFLLIDNAQDVLRFLYDLHIEAEITERDEFIQEAMKHGANKGALELGELRLVEKMFDSGRYKLVDGE